MKSIIATVVSLCLALFVANEFASSAPPTPRHVLIELPGSGTGMKNVASRVGLACRFELLELITPGESLDLELREAEPGEWKPLDVKVGRLLQVSPARGAKPATKNGDRLSIAWKLPFDPEAAKKRFDSEKGKLEAEAGKQADEKKLTGGARDTYLAKRIKELMAERAAELHDQFVHNKDRLAAESLLTARLNEKDAPKLSDEESATFIKELMLLRAKQPLRASDFERAFEAIKPIREKFDQLAQQMATERVKKAEEEAKRKFSEDERKKLLDEERKKLRDVLPLQLAKEWLSDYESHQTGIGGYPPPELAKPGSELRRLQQVCEWIEIEPLFTTAGLKLGLESSKWMTLHAEAMDVLLKRPSASKSAKPLLGDAERQQLQQAAETQIEVEFVPWLAEKKPDVGWGAAHTIALRPDVVGSVVWRGQTGTGLSPRTAWLKVEAPDGWLWELKSPSREATCCLVQGRDGRYLRVAPRAGRATAEFEVRLHHSEVRGPEVKWNQPSSNAAAKFPF